MGNRKRKRKNNYDASLWNIFIRSGFDVFFAMLMVCIVVGLLAALYQRVESEAIRLISFCFVIAVAFSYFLPLCSLFQVWRQQRILGIYWKDRTDHDQPVSARDWYLAYNRGGFLLYHRAYIQCLLRSEVVEQTTDRGREKVYCIKFQDIRGKKHTIKFSSAQDRKKFRQWYESTPQGQSAKA